MSEHRIQIAGSKVDECGIARKLLTNGAQPDDTMTTYRGEMRCLTGKVGWFAKQVVRETAKEGPYFVRWRPFDPSTFHSTSHAQDEY
jgi:hypothetical protein